MKKKDILFGKNSIVEALKNGISIDAILINNTAKDMGEIQALAKANDVPFKKVPVQKIEYILFPFYKHQSISHQGIVAILNEFDYSNIDDIYNFKISEGKQPVFVYLDRMTDVGNFGAISRDGQCTSQ
jgi:23S rRNA (guanosine2251-2'-O)-methyltransferase